MSNVSSLSGGSAGTITGQLDVNYIVEQIIYAKQQPIRDLQTFETFYTAKKEAFQELNTKVSSLESSIYNMNNTGFNTKSATLTSEEYLTATASTSASNGNYSLVVKQLAASKSYTSGGVPDADTKGFTDGKVTIKNYDGSTVLGEVDFTGSTQSLNGIKDAINSMGLDFTATVINYGTSASPSYKLQVTADNTGVENGFVIETSGAGVLPTFTEASAAKDAQIYVNTDPATNPTAYISRSSNTISDIISGVTLNLKKADTLLTAPTKLTVGSDSAVLKENIQTFVDRFNEVMDYLNAQFTFDEEKQAAGVLSGESAARKIKEDLLSMASTQVQGLSGSNQYNSFSVVGLEFNRTGNLEINDSKLDDVIENHLDALKQVLKDGGSTSNSDISYAGKADSTVAGTYAVHINTVAEQAVRTAMQAFETLTAAENLTIKYAGKTIDVALLSGWGSSDVIDAINTAMEDNDLAVTARLNASGFLEISSNDYGSTVNIAAYSDTAAGAGTTGLGTSTTADFGVDVAGTIGGYAASGSGTILTGTAGDSKGLIVNVTASSLADPLNGDDKGTVSFTRGVAELLREKMYEASFPYSGLLSKNIDSFDEKLLGITNKIKDINRSLASEQEILIMQFTKANEALAEMAYIKSTLSGK